MFARVCSVEVLLIGKLKAVHAKWLAEGAVDDDEEEESDEPLVSGKASEDEEADEEEDDEEPESCAELAAKLEQDRQAPSSLGSSAPAEEDVLLMPAPPAPALKPSPKDPKLSGGPKGSSQKRGGSGNILGSPGPPGSKTAKKEASPVLAAESSKKNKRKRAAAALHEAGDDADGDDVAAPRKLKLAKTGLRKRYFPCVACTSDPLILMGHVCARCLSHGASGSH